VNREFKFSIDDGPDVMAKGKIHGYISHVRVFPVTAGDLAATSAVAEA
jgi:hypothetical protein